MKKRDPLDLQLHLKNLDLNKPLLLLDLDETLVYTEFSESPSTQEGHEASVKVRPYTPQFLQEMSKFCFFLTIVF